MQSRPEKDEKEVRGPTGLCRVATEPADYLSRSNSDGPFYWRLRIFNRDVIAEIFLEGLLVRDTARFRRAM
jgi:hypothetical protein